MTDTPERCGGSGWIEKPRPDTGPKPGPPQPPPTDHQRRVRGDKPCPGCLDCRCERCGHGVEYHDEDGLGGICSARHGTCPCTRTQTEIRKQGEVMFPDAPATPDQDDADLVGEIARYEHRTAKRAEAAEARAERLAEALRALIAACPVWMSSGPDASPAMTKAQAILTTYDEGSRG